MKAIWFELAIPWWWHRTSEGQTCEVLLVAVWWTDGPGFSVSFTRSDDWTPLRVIREPG